ncbi:hypothetical protein GWI72_06515 [Microvirga tunisiensis]|uniref:NHLP leader peptide family natural product n=1 Tax=Pannonibacter tanglangensis TaxID=2750084 RepID=A0A7X5F341_9HYPH|nr:hypothetical protein [Pannonibacter sp. XCT-53]NBN77920.1 hypothetical protein [Pannonibacter sp. XCT-53]
MRDATDIHPMPETRPARETAEGQSLERVIQDRAAADPAFRAALLADPLAAIAGAFRLAPMPGLKLRVIEEQPGEVVLVLPRAAALEADELSEAELAKASGGFSGVNGQIVDSVTQTNVKLPGGPNAMGAVFLRPGFRLFPF